MRALVFLAAGLFFVFNFAFAGENPWLAPAFYSFEGREREVSFKGIFRTDWQSLNEISALSNEEKQAFGQNQIAPTLKFLFGPLTNRVLGSPQRGLSIDVDWSSAKLLRGKVALSYSYRAVWIVERTAAEQFVIPVPFNKANLLTPHWKRCTDSDPEHQTEGFYWYFWDPQRSGCDHKLGIQYQEIAVQLGAETTNEASSYPEYKKLLQSSGQPNRFQLTFGFGYVLDPANPEPEKDFDAGALEYQEFVKQVRNSLGASVSETKILQAEYRGGSQPDKEIGHRFMGKLKGVDIVINVVAAAGVDQMEIFAKSFAHDHDGFFGWFGHSRVGSGFDAQNFKRIVMGSPSYYSITPNYQLVYWGGCNSYSYYTLPFFEFKAQVANGADPNGTKGLDIIANGLPSYFSLNSDNASIVLDNLLRWEERPSYQTIVNALEAKAKSAGINVLVAVLGDEDNDKD